MPDKLLYENKENLQVHTIVKLGCSPNYDGIKNDDETHLALCSLEQKIFGELPIL